MLQYHPRPSFALLAVGDLSKVLHLGEYCLTEAALRQHLVHGQADMVAQAYAVAAGIDGHPPPSFSAEVRMRDSVFCGADGRPVFTGDGGTAVPARTDQSGIFHVLRLSPPG